MDIDILAALHTTNLQRGTKRCKVQKILDEIPDETPGKDQLAGAVLDTTFAGSRLTLTFSALGKPVGADLINDHRGNRCACYR